MSKTVYIGHAVGDEHHKSKGGEAGNQGDELRKSKWYLNTKGWRCFRAPKNAKLIADDMRYAIANKNIGYDQSQRNTLWNAAAKVGYNCSLVTVPCETDCSALVRVCIAYAGYVTPNFNTVSEPTRLLSAGFVEMIGEKYTTMPDYLCEGDILVTKTKGHTVVVLNDGDKANEPEPGAYVFTRLLKYGCVGEDVIELKELLIAHGFSKGITVDTASSKRFGSATKRRVKEFQKSVNIKVDGIAGHDTIIALGGVWLGE